MKWEQVGVGGGNYIEIRASGAKKRVRRIVPISDNLKEWIAPVRKSEGPIWKRSEANFFKHMARLAKRAKVKWKTNALRHSYISYRVALTGDVAKVSLEAGNSPEMIHANYLHHVSAEEAEKWFALKPDTAENIIPLSVTTAAGPVEEKQMERKASG
jgi:integrase